MPFTIDCTDNEHNRNFLKGISEDRCGNVWITNEALNGLGIAPTVEDWIADEHTQTDCLASYTPLERMVFSDKQALPSPVAMVYILQALPDRNSSVPESFATVLSTLMLIGFHGFAAQKARMIQSESGKAIKRMFDGLFTGN